MKFIPLTRGLWAKIDDEDFQRVSAVNWRSNLNGAGTPYARSKHNGFLHRFILSAPRGMVVDHVNHDTLDCRKSNLRLCSVSENGMNRKGATRFSASGVRGVSWDKIARKWRAQIKMNGKSKYIGLFDSIDLAASAYSVANKNQFGAFGGGL